MDPGINGHVTYERIIKIHPNQNSVAIRDALAMFEIPVVEIHLSRIHKREPFRHQSMIADIAAARIVGFGSHGYMLALEGLAKML